jgi:hypothetical protein
MKVKITVAVLLAIVLTYRLIPKRIRGLWKRNGETSHIALEGLLHHGDINSFFWAADTWDDWAP